jgi:hypothetical protein
MTIRSKSFGSVIGSNLKMLGFSMFARPLLFRSSKELSEELKKLTRCSNTIYFKYFFNIKKNNINLYKVIGHKTNKQIKK